jgi:hypothetical protein
MHQIPKWLPRVMEGMEEILCQSYLEVDSIFIIDHNHNLVVGSLGSPGKGGPCPFFHLSDVSQLY